MSQSRTFTIRMETKDCECDLQGIINNSVYLNYLEHTRHKFLRHVGLDFGALHYQGVDAVVHRIKIHYRRSLRGMEEFVSNLQVSRKGKLQYVFDQSIRRISDNAEMVTARTFVAFVSGGRPIKPPAAVESAVTGWLTLPSGET